MQSHGATAEHGDRGKKAVLKPELDTDTNTGSDAELRTPNSELRSVMLLLAALVATTITILILRITFGFLWRPLRPPQRGPSFWRLFIRAALTVIIRRLRVRGNSARNRGSHIPR